MIFYMMLDFASFTRKKRESTRNRTLNPLPPKKLPLDPKKFLAAFFQRISSFSGSLNLSDLWPFKSL